MPYLKDDKPFVEIERLLRGRGLIGSRLARVLNTSEGTARSRLRTPGTITLFELERICKEGHVPAEEIREAVKFR